MAWHSGKPADSDFLSASVQHIRENFAELEPLHPHVAELVDLTALHPHVAALLDSRIVEMGSNSNGEYVRWENGLQVCYGTKVFTANANGDTTVDVTFPAVFAAPGSVLGVLAGPYFAPSARAEWALQGNPTTQRFQFHLIGLESRSCTIQFCAIGRWK